MREAERAVTRAFGRFHAGCHASNRSMSYLDPPRAWSLAARHGWSANPSHVARPGSPGCIEVYPHPATVSLFGLSRVLKYNRGPVETLREALLELLGHLEGLRALRLAGHDRWSDVRAAVEAALRPDQLDAVEDEVHAVLCAHLAWLWDTGRSSLLVFSGADGGFIVTPPAAGPPNRSVQDHSPVRGCEPARAGERPASEPTPNAGTPRHPSGGAAYLACW